MRRTKGGIIHMAEIIKEDLMDREIGLSKPQIGGLADLAASVLGCRSVNTTEIANILPRDVKSNEERYRFINRWLRNKNIDPIKVMSGFIPEILELITRNGQIAILAIDQSKISDGFECLMVSLRHGERAIPVGWMVKETEGPIGFNVQKPLLEKVKAMIPTGVKIMLAGDRFYGTAALIGWCQRQGWSYRIRLKSDLIVSNEQGTITTGQAAQRGIKSLINVQFNEHIVSTNIGIIHEAGHKEPWIIAMDAQPSDATTLDYGMRWGIESLFSDIKSRGFSITQTHLQHPDRIERLLLVLTIALFWAVSTGMEPPSSDQQPSKKKAFRSLTSFFKRGLRIILNAILMLSPLPTLWEFINYVR